LKVPSLPVYAATPDPFLMCIIISSGRMMIQSERPMTSSKTPFKVNTPSLLNYDGGLAFWIYTARYNNLSSVKPHAKYGLIMHMIPSKIIAGYQPPAEAM